MTDESMAVSTPPVAPADGAGATKPRRELCSRCRRPKRACLCFCLPPAAVPTAGIPIVLQHPLERGRRHATVPLLELCLSRCEVMLGRYYRREVHVPLREAIERHVRGEVPLFVLFPGWGACGADEAGEALRDGRIRYDADAKRWTRDKVGAVEQPAAANDARSEGDVDASSPSLPLYSLLAFDATWPHGKEMATKIFPNLPEDVIHVEIRGARVDTAGDDKETKGKERKGETGEDGIAVSEEKRVEHSDGLVSSVPTPSNEVVREVGSPDVGAPVAAELPSSAAPTTARLNLRVEPIAGLLTTAEAVARAVAALEPAEGGAGRCFSHLERAIDDPSTAAEWVVAALAGWVEQGSKWDPALRARAEGGDNIKRTPGAKHPKAKLRPSQEEGDRIALEQRRRDEKKAREE